MPVFLLPGNVGDFVGPIALSVVLALSVSFSLSMTLIPALAARVVRPDPALGREPRSWWRQGWSSPALTALYRGLLRGALERPALTVLACLALPAGGFWALTQLEDQFFPASDRDQLEVQVWMGPASGVSATDRTVRAMEGLIRDAGAVRSITWVVGASSPPVYYNQLRDQDDNPAYARGTLTAASPGEAKRLAADLQDRLSDAFPEARVVVRSFGQGPPAPAPVALRLVGPDPDVLRQLGAGLRGLLSEDPSVTQSLASIQGGEPKLWLGADEQEARRAGLSLRDVAAQFQGALDGAWGGQVLEDLETLPVRVRLPDIGRDDPERMASHRLVAAGPTADGGPLLIPAEALGDLTLAPKVSAITRRNGERVNTVQAWIRPEALPIEVSARLHDRFEAGALALPPGYRLEVAGDSEESAEAVGQLLAYAPLLGALMVATLVLSFRSFALAANVGLVGILSLGLGFLSLWIAGYPLGFNPLIGSAGLLGVAINASIVVLSAIRSNPLARAGEVQAIVEEVLLATRHIVATTLTTLGGFLPLVLAGGDFWPPLAVVIAGGVGLSIVLGLLFSPALYRLGLRLRRRRLDRAIEAQPVAAG
jgi:multidrug efflux pump subunit AcrB